MKNFKLILSVMFVFFVAQLNTMAQTEKKPTKEETMEWIAGKLKEHLTGGREFVSYNDGLFSYKKVLSSDVCVTTIDLNKVKSMSNIYSKDFFIQGDGMLTVKCDNSVGNGKNAVSISGQNFNKYTAPFYVVDDPLIERLKKAFKTLIEYNSPKDANEAF
ncbi:MAG TPA: hypothetical protein PKN22_01500 [Taishania sp.]|nr:hypothetical protein [Taishania sp.]HNS41408.1 hypothetical protein [Taishania sp.]